jgi:hypothetical protein
LPPITNPLESTSNVTPCGLTLVPKVKVFWAKVFRAKKERIMRVRSLGIGLGK